MAPSRKKQKVGEDEEKPVSVPPEEEELDAETILSNMLLKRIIKENHNSRIKQIVFNKHVPYRNLLASVGDDQVGSI
jgi:hypothetical protein